VTRGRPPASASRIVPVTLEGTAGPLEALLQEHDAHDHALTVVACHPHPLYGGTFHNKVIHRAASTLHELGAAVLRFNFRGVGRSAGAFDRGAGELEDARTALDFLRRRYPEARRWAAGFSFGSWIAARLAAAEPDIEHLTLIAPPVATQDFSVLESLATPKLVVQGTADVTCPLAALQERFPRWAEPKQVVVVAGATHFFDRQLAALAQALRDALAPRAPGGLR
jgi:hypothetical protein